MTRRSHRRAGYTLLEVLLATLIAVILLAALYVTLDVTLVRMDTGRDQVGSYGLGRAVVNRMASDLTGVLGPLPPKSGGSGSSSDSSGASGSGGSASPSGSGGSGTSTAASGSGTGTAAATGGGATASAAGSGGSGTTTATDPSAQSQTPTTNIPFHAGVIGTDKQLTAFVSRVPESMTDPEAALDPTALLPADVRRVTYYLSPDGLGLCRQERPWATADGVWNSADPDLSTADRDVIAPEVKDVTFEYFDGADWQSSWDGSQPGSDGVTPLGPPRAVRATFVLQFPGRGGEVTERRVQHVVPIRAAVGTYTPPDTGTTTGPAGGTTTTGGM